MSSEEIIGAAEVLADAQRLAEGLQSALEMRAVIDQAIGVTMSQSGGTQAEALDRLRVLSQTQHRELAVIARGIVEGTVGLAPTCDH